MGLDKTALNEWHKAHAKMSSFGGWELPVRFSSTRQEHMSVRGNVGLFDISHMGRISVEGPGATEFLNYFLTRDIDELSEGRCGYAIVCNERGGTKEDLIVNKFSGEEYLLVCNAANRFKILWWLRSFRDFISLISEEHGSKSSEIFSNLDIEDKTLSTIQLAIQGPKADRTLRRTVNEDLPEDSYAFKVLNVSGFESIVSRTGYTGEDGFEIIPLEIPNEPNEDAVSFWDSILEAGKEFEIEPCGLGARDTLRLEAGLCLYGNDLTEDITPLEAKLEFVVNLSEDSRFIGKERLLEQKDEGLKKVRIGLEMVDSGIPRSGMTIERGDEEVGEVTSGTFSPVLEKGVGMGYVPPRYAEKDAEITIEIRDRKVRARVVEWPFFSGD